MNERELAPTVGLAFRVWWALTWRALPLSILGGIIIGIVIGIIGVATGVDKEAVTSISTFAGAIVGLIVTILVIYRLMARGFGRFRIGIMEK